LTEKKRRGPNKPIRPATKDYRNNKKDRQSNKTLDTKEKTKNVLAEEKQEHSSLKAEQSTTTTAAQRIEFLPEVFDSSGYDAMSEMKDSASINEDDLKKAISNVQKKESVRAEDISLQPSNINEYLQSVNPITIMQEETTILGGSKEERSKEEGSNYEKRLNGDNPFMSSIALWQGSMISWIGIYKDFSENVAKMMRDYWMKPSWISHIGE
jgi:hypothetical protein